MTRKQAETRLTELRNKRNALVDQIADVDAQSGSISAAGGSKSYTNRKVEELQLKLRILEREIGKLEAALGLRPDSPSAIKTIYPRYH